MVTWFKGDRRKKYRVEPERLGVVEVSLLRSSRKLLPGELINMSLDGSAVFFPAKQCPDLRPNERVKLQFGMTQTKKSVTIDAIVKDSCTAGDSGSTRYFIRQSPLNNVTIFSPKARYWFVLINS